LQSGSGFAWNLDRSAFIGECVEQPSSIQQVYFYRNGSDNGSMGFDDINVSRGSNEFILYTPQYGVDTGTTTSSDAIEVLVQLKRPSLIVPYSHMAAAEKGDIVKISNKGSTPIPFDHVVLSLHGTKKDEFLSLWELGDKIGISQKIKDCGAYPQNKWDYTYASIGGAFYFLKAGVVQDFSSDPQANVRDPRTAIVFNNDYIYFIVVDGRDELNSLGMTIPQLANFAKDELGATYGIAQDGGGSSTMVVNGEVKNNSYCNIVICKNRHFLPLITKSGSSLQSGQFGPQDGSLQFAPASTPDPVERLSGDGLPLTEEYYTYSQDTTGAILQRLVANGMMMVVVEPKDLSPIFTENETIKTLTQVDVRLGPGTNYGLIETVDAGTTGIIYGKDNGLNGVWAKGYYWWHVLLEIDDRDVIGWVIEPALTKVLQ
ncbi:MAG: phosphodiester glycosidase family protein, partial [Anaerolineales bacterium]